MSTPRRRSSGHPARRPVTSRADLVTRLREAGCVFAEDEADLLLAELPDPSALADAVERRTAGIPLEVVVGWVDLGGTRLAVGPGVFVPRRRSLLAVRLAAEMLRAGDVVVDLCCGVGALGRLVASLVPGVAVYATDIDPNAVTYATGNLAVVGGVALVGDLFAPLPRRLRGHVSVVVANAPYVPRDEVRGMPREAWEHEPLTALDGGPDGLDLHRRIAARAAAWVRPGGHVVLETSGGQAAGTRAAFDEGWTTSAREDAGLDATAVCATRLR